MITYSRSATYYDALNDAAGKDYAREATLISELADRYRRSSGRALLDVGCGTGRHLEHFSHRYACEGLDLDRGMLAVASERCPGVRFHLTDMIGFNLGKRFDIITCLYGTAAYLPTVGRFAQVIASFARHLVPGGVAIVEPWLQPEEWEEGRVSARFADLPEMKIARMHIGRRDEHVAILNFHYMVALKDGIRSFEEMHRLMLLSDEEYRIAFARAGFELHRGTQIFDSRGLYIGVLPALGA